MCGLGGFTQREAHHWSAKIKHRDIQGGQCDGLFWRHSRAEWLKSGAEGEYEAPWIEAHGEQAMLDALHDTEEAFLASRARGEPSSLSQKLLQRKEQR